MPKQLKKIFIILVLLIVIAVVLIKVINIQNIIMEKLYPKEYSEYVYTYSEENNLDPLLVFAIIKASTSISSNIITIGDSYVRNH